MANELPNRWTRKHGAIYYQVPKHERHLWDNKTWFRLGKSETAAWRTWKERHKAAESTFGLIKNTKNVSLLMDFWIEDHVNNRKRIRPATATQHLNSLKRLRPVFGHMEIGDIKRSHIKQYYMMRYDKFQTSAKREYETIRSFLNWCLDHDLIEVNVAKQMNIPQPKPRIRYVKDRDVEMFLEFCSPFLQRYIKLKLYTGARKNDLLSLRRVHWREDGLIIGDRKSYRALTGERKLGRIFRRCDELEELMDELLEHAGKDYLFETSNGNPYINFETDKTEGFNSIWQRAKQRALAGGMKQCESEDKPHYLSEDEGWAYGKPIVFQERDLRAKAATDLDDIHNAQLMLGHTNLNTTMSIYKRKPLVVK